MTNQSLKNAFQTIWNKVLEVLDMARSDLITHINNTNNPHNVTADQVGAEPLGSVDTAYENLLYYMDDCISEWVGDTTVSNQISNAIASKADLSGGKVPSSQLPSYVDDVLEYSAKSSFPSTGETGKIYVDTTTNLTYRWSGSAYVEISQSLALGETSSTAYRGDRGKIAYDHTSNKSNPHGVTKSQVGLGNVDNTSDANKPISTATQTALNGKANASHTHSYAGSSSAGGPANSAVKLATARTIGLGTGATGTATSFDGSANITIPVTSVKEAYLSWGGKNITGGYSPVDAAMVPDLGANRLAFMPAAGVEVQYSRDGGSTWSTYSTSDANKINLFNGNGAGHQIGASSAIGIDKSNYQLRITITTNTASVYTALNKFVIYCSTNGSSGAWCTIDGKTKANVDSGTDTWVTFANKVSLSGWSGYNVINTPDITTYGNTSAQHQKLRFTFGVTSHPSSSSYSGLIIYKIMGFGGMGWTTPSTMASNGHMYTYDASKNVTFPATVTATTLYSNGTEVSVKGHTHTVANISDLTATATELNYCDGVTSNIQTQLNGKASSSHNHSASNITSGTLGVARGGTGATTAAEARSNLGLSGAQTKTLLWQNASSTSSFAPQIIPGLDASGYDTIEIITRTHKTDAAERIDRVVKGATCCIAFVWNVRHVRAIHFGIDGKVNVKVGNKSSSVTASVSNDNQAVIPLKIYGIKEV